MTMLLTRAAEALRRAGITPEASTHYDDEALLGLRMIGKGTLEELRRAYPRAADSWELPTPPLNPYSRAKATANEAQEFYASVRKPLTVYLGWRNNEWVTRTEEIAPELAGELTAIYLRFILESV